MHIRLGGGVVATPSCNSEKLGLCSQLVAPLAATDANETDTALADTVLATSMRQTRSKTAREATQATSELAEPQHGLDALRLVLDHHETEETVALRRQVAELRQACPALCAEPGSGFEHRRDAMMVEASFDRGEHESFEYLGRREGGGKAANPHHSKPITICTVSPSSDGRPIRWLGRRPGRMGDACGLAQVAPHRWAAGSGRH